MQNQLLLLLVNNLQRRFGVISWIGGSELVDGDDVVLYDTNASLNKQHTYLHLSCYVYLKIDVTSPIAVPNEKISSIRSAPALMPS
jgi:hypothetical protein